MRHAPQKDWYLGILSGTSIDGIDIVLADFSNEQPKVVAATTAEIPKSLRQQLTQLCTCQNNNEIFRLGVADRLFSQSVSEAVLTFLDDHGIAADEITAIGFHGQTIRHHPDIDTPFTWQLGCPETLATLCNIPVISHFRQKDIALGGQGAPLAPALHQAMFAQQDVDVAVVNLGGIANISFLGSDGTLNGFDCGPASTLLDYWYTQHHPNARTSYDVGGHWAKQGQVNQRLLEAMLSDPYFDKTPPKSTGREYFTPEWLHRHIQRDGNEVRAVDIQATVLELTAVTLVSALKEFAPAQQVYCCGGGVFNDALMARCAQLWKQAKWSNTQELGVAPQWVEGILFAWLARRFENRIVTDLTQVTGASRPALLGRYTPAI
ncbi:anhydro-N-acetylmuramic acid kinase [Aliidiomarina sp. B3213]|nr:anhydro-N-acetylmuramic acid kinase [Aliidiomarina sp. B3213]RTE85630.1 anhydro-N-acetylmuramic acid kinase [Aliidiomarina sp. B3213]